MNIFHCISQSQWINQWITTSVDQESTVDPCDHTQDGFRHRTKKDMHIREATSFYSLSKGFRNKEGKRMRNWEIESEGPHVEVIIQTKALKHNISSEKRKEKEPPLSPPSVCTGGAGSQETAWITLQITERRCGRQREEQGIKVWGDTL